MESLIAAYAASDEEDEQEDERASSSEAAAPKKIGSLFTSLPEPKKIGGLFASLPEPKKPLFSSLPEPKKGNKVVEFRPPVDLSSLEEDEQEERANRNRRKRSQPAEEAGSGGGGALGLPAPRNTSGALGSGLGLGGRRVAMETPTVDPPEQEGEIGSGAYYGAAVYGGPGPSGYEAGEPVYGGPGPSGYEPGEPVCEGPGPSGYDEAQYEIAADPVAKADMRRDRRDAVKFVQIKQSDLTANRPREDQMRATGIAFGSMFEKCAPGEKPSKMHRKKHQIGSLLYDMKEKEMELAERRARGFLNKSQTHAKYGW